MRQVRWEVGIEFAEIPLAVERRGDRLDGDTRGDLTMAMSSHAVCNYIDLLFEIDIKRILVVLPDPANIGQPADLQCQAIRSVQENSPLCVVVRLN